jgi:PadR family transcriptional regulator, regulatory protein PadR
MGSPGLGELELRVLLAVVRLGDGAYAVSVRDEIAARAGHDVSRGTIYVTLDRMARKGLLQDRLGEPTAERGGKARRLFTATAAGAQALRQSLAGTRALLQGLPADIEGAP